MVKKSYSILAILDILTEYTDKDHFLTARQIIHLLKQKYQIQVIRRTVYANIDLLIEAGYAISKYDDTGKGYRIDTKQFDKAEILMLCNALHASHFISEEQSKTIINKLLKTQSKNEAAEFNNSVYLPNKLKTENNEVLRTIKLISEAVRDHKMIRFVYMKYDQNKQLVPRRDIPYVVEPRYIVYSDSRPYLVSTSPKHSGYIHYRIDRMSDTRILDKEERYLPDIEDPYQYAKNKLFMFSGDMFSVSFLCEERIMDQMVDIFGPEVFIMKKDKDCFLLTTKTSKKGAIFLAQQFIDAIEIVEPFDLRKEFLREIESAAERYKTKRNL